MAGTDVWWLDDIELRWADTDEFLFTGKSDDGMVPGTHPHYVSTSSSGTVHLHVVNCSAIWYCMRAEYAEFNGGGGVTGLFWTFTCVASRHPTSI